MSNNKQNLLSLNQTALTKFFETLGEKPYRVKQLMQWIYKYYEFESHSIQHNVIKSIRDLRQVGGFLWVLRFPPPIKLTTII
jgi:23S rRNA (adenine2503-C2)-methyltransferase